VGYFHIFREGLGGFQNFWEDNGRSRFFLLIFNFKKRLREFFGLLEMDLGIFVNF
jgi:hypothetical protein